MKKLLIFAKYPEAGKVKSRLARAIGAVQSALVYKTMVEIVVRNTESRPEEYERVLFYDPPESKEKFRSWLPIRHLQPQSGGDLGKRMQKALSQTLAKARQALLIGTDCLDVDRSLILKAFHHLEKADLVLGPAKDGGYYLIGCQRIYPELFAGIDWSTDRVLLQTLQIAKNLNLRVTLLPELEDIDTIEQYLRKGPCGRLGEKIQSDLPSL